MTIEVANGIATSGNVVAIRERLHGTDRDGAAAAPAKIERNRTRSNMPTSYADPPLSFIRRPELPTLYAGSVALFDSRVREALAHATKPRRRKKRCEINTLVP